MSGLTPIWPQYDPIGPVSKDRLREILVDSVEELLKQINADEELRPFLKNYPFTENEVEIELYIVNKHGESLLYPNICIGSAYERSINFTTNLKQFDYNSETESFEDAARIVRDSKKKETFQNPSLFSREFISFFKSSIFIGNCEGYSPY